MIVIIDYKSGNSTSVSNALNRLGVKNCVSSNPIIIASAQGLIFPGQGRARQAMDIISSLGIDRLLKEARKPFLGICLGMQLLLEFSEEDNNDCLGVIPGRVRRFSDERGCKIPQVGWNSVHLTSEDPLFKGIPDGSFFYFVNSYYANPIPSYISATTYYGIKFASVIKKGNFYGTQFHPEKSATVGLQLLKNFCALALTHNS